MISRHNVARISTFTLGVILLWCVLLFQTIGFGQRTPLSEDPFSRMEPMSFGTNLWSVASLHVDTAMTAGDDAHVRITYDWGSTWIDHQNLDSVGTQLLSVSLIDSVHAYAVGQAGAVLKTTDGGMSWNETITDTLQTLFGVAFTDTMNGTVVGDHGLILQTTDGGLTWSKTRKDSSKYSPLLAVSFTDVHNGTIAGGSGTILRTTDGGSSWVQQSSGVTNYLYGISFVSSTTGTVVGTKGVILRTTDGGATWNKQTRVIDTAAHTTTDSIHYLYAVSFRNDSEGIAVGNGGRIIMTTDAGSNWYVQQSKTANNLYGVTFLDTNRWIAVGGFGVIISRGDTGIVVTSAREKNSLPSATLLEQNYPNPFNPQTTIPFTLTRRSDVILEMYDILGRKVATLLSGTVEAGRHSVHWNASGVSSGIYMYMLQVRTGENPEYLVQTRKLLLVK